jgi:hypothetical protein
MGMKELKAQLPPDVREVMKKYEDAVDYANPEYVNAVDESSTRVTFAYFRMARQDRFSFRALVSAKFRKASKVSKGEPPDRL